MIAIDPKNYNDARRDLTKLIASWESRVAEVKANRKFRKLTKDPDKLRKQKKLAKDETLIIIRSIDNNIRRIKPHWTGYITNSRRLVEITDDLAGGKTSIKAKRLEADFSKKMRTGGAIRSFTQQIDGCLLHGITYADVVFDSSKPLHFAVEYCAADKLLYEQHVEDIQDSRWVLRRFDMTLSKLEEMSTKLDFNEKVVEDILDKLRQQVGDEALKEWPISIYKGYVKIDGVTHVFHYSDEHGSSDWLKKPIPLYVGLDDAVINEESGEEEYVPRKISYFPVYTLEYETTEDEKIVDNKGRAHIDKPIQEAETVLASSSVTRSNRSSKIFFSTKEATDGGMSTTDDILEDGKVFKQPLNAMTLPPGTGDGLATWQVLRTVSAQNAGSVSTSFQDKRTARTTAKEVENAQDQETSQASMGINNLAFHIVSICELGLEIAISQALQERIRFVYDAEAEQNDEEILNGVYSVHPAGDADAAQRRQTLQQMKEFWPMASETDIAHEYLARMLELALPPQEAEIFVEGIRNSANTKAVIGKLVEALQAAMSPEEYQALPQQDRQRFDQLLATGAQLAGFTPQQQ